MLFLIASIRSNEAIYSGRIAIIGSTLAARRPASQAAINAIDTKIRLAAT